MRDEEAQNLSRGDFKRSYGVYPETFKDMVQAGSGFSSQSLLALRKSCESRTNASKKNREKREIEISH
jgi:hypothetical protein